MDHNEIDWDELVDLYVDNECSEEERRLVESRIEQDETVAASVRAARRIREGLLSMRSEVPAGFDLRLQQAIADALEKEARSIPCVAKREDPLKKFFFGPRVWTGIAASLAVVLGGVAYFEISRPDSVAPTVVSPKAKLVMEDTVVDEVGVKERVPFIMIPSPEGKIPRSVMKRDTQDAIWVEVVLSDRNSMSRRLVAFQRLCGKLGVNFIKCGNDNEYILQEVQPRQWKSVAETLELCGDTKLSNAMVGWLEGTNDEPASIRVVFKAASDGSIQEGSEPGIE